MHGGYETGRSAKGAQRSALVLCAALAALLAASARPARAQVLEIQDDGSVVTYAGPARAQAPAAAGRSAVVQDLHAAAARYGLSEPLLEAVALRESGLRQDAVSPKGARGVMQLMPGTARALGVRAADRSDNINGGAEYLSLMLTRFDGDLVRALAAYNAGPEAVERFGGVPPFTETKAYVNAIMEHLADVSVGLVKEGPR